VGAPNLSIHQILVDGLVSIVLLLGILLVLHISQVLTVLLESHGSHMLVDQLVIQVFQIFKDFNRV